jgi:adenylosuccinate synthase
MKRASLVIGLMFGDEGKGSVVDALVRRRKAGLVVRFNGGSQAAHNVVSPEGVHHCFSQFGSGALVPGVTTYLSRFMLVDPLGLTEEAEVLAKKVDNDPWSNLIIDALCPVITPYHRAVNRLKEMIAANERRGSCGKGVGEAVKDVETLGDNMLFVGDLGDEEIVRWKLEGIRLRKLDVFEQLIDCHQEIVLDDSVKELLMKLRSGAYLNALIRAYRAFAFGYGLVVDVGGEYLSDLLKERDSIFEGAQGVLLDCAHGFFPYVTPTTTTFDNAISLLSEVGFKGEVEKIGVVRAYATRHGPGPFPTHDKDLEVAIPDGHNVFGEWQREFRVGWFDVPLVRYALEVCGGVDSLAITNLDRLEGVGEVKVGIAYDFFGDNAFKRRFSVSKARLRKQSEPSIERQAEMAKFLNDCRPVLAKIGQGIGRKKFQGYVSFLEGALGAKSSLLSFGPMVIDKLFL